MEQEGTIVVDEEGNVVSPQEQQPNDAGSNQEEGGDNADARLNNEETADEELAAATNEEEREAIRAVRRQERQDRKQRQREREDRLRRELAARDEIISDMRSRLDAVERRGFGADVAQLDNAIKQNSDAYAYFKQQLKDAAAANNGELVAEATEKMLQVQRKVEDLNRIRQAYTSEQNRAPQPRPMDPRVTSNAQAWASQHSWYDVNGRDMDSRIAATVDATLTQEGWDPRTEQYWDELDARLKKYLPHRYDSRQNTGSEHRSASPVAGSGKSEAAGSGKGNFTLSPARVAAIKEAGKWEDAKERQKMIKAYRDYDRQRAEQKR